MKVLLINPPWSNVYGKLRIGAAKIAPLGLAYIASYLEENNVDADILDADALELTYDEIKREISKRNVDVVGTTCVTPTFAQVKEIAKICKELNKDIYVVIGGNHPTALPSETLEQIPWCDIIVRNEGELTFLDLIRCLEKDKNLHNVLGISFRENNKIIHTLQRNFITNIDKLPFPARHLLPNHLYRPSFHRGFGMKNVNFATIITSRGCPFNCNFCSSRIQWGGKVRMRSPENVIEEIEYLLNEYNVGEIAIYDDTFTVNKKRVEKICDLLIEKRIRIGWSAEARVDTLSVGMLKKMKKAGCRTIYIGVESGSSNTLNSLNKGIDLKQIQTGVKMIKKTGLNIVASYMVGNRGETKQDIEQTIKLAKKLNTDHVLFYITTPYPGTQLYKEVEEKGLLLSKNWSKYIQFINNGIIKLDRITQEDLDKIYSSIYKRYYLRPRYILMCLSKIRSFDDIKSLLWGFKIFKKMIGR